MNRELYIEYLKNPEKLDTESLEKIRLILDEYPYFQTNRLLYVKNLHNLKDVRFDSQLKLSAVYAPDREKLYALINPQNIPNLIDIKSIGLDKTPERDDDKAIETHQAIEEEISVTHKLAETESINDHSEELDSTSTFDSDDIDLVVDSKGNEIHETQDELQNEEQNQELSVVLDDKKDKSEQNNTDISIENNEQAQEEDSSESLREKPDSFDAEGVSKPESQEFITEKTSPEIDIPPSAVHKTASEEPVISSDSSGSSHISDLILQKIKIAKGEEDYNPEVDRQTEDNKAELLKKIQDRLNEINDDKNKKQEAAYDVKADEGISEEQSANTLEIETEPKDITLNIISEEVDPLEEQYEDVVNQSLESSEIVSDIISDKNDLHEPHEPEEIIEDSEHISEQLQEDLSDQSNTESVNDLLFDDFEDFIDADDLFGKRDSKRSAIDKKLIPPLEISPYNNDDIVKNHEKIQEKKTKKNDLIDKFISENKSSLNMTPSVSEDGSEPEFQLPPQEEFFSETLAKIYIKQGHYERALLTYEKLYLKYPEKSVYFANQINKVKELIKNKNN